LDQPADLYFLSRQKIGIFGIANEGTDCQTFYYFPELELNNYILWYLIYKTFITKELEEITLNFLIQGHTKFSCDRFFGHAKLQLKKTDCVEAVDDVHKVIHESTFNQAIMQKVSHFEISMITGG